MAYNWRVIRSGYESAGLPFHELAEKYGHSADAIERRAKKEGWRAAAEGAIFAGHRG